MKIIGAEEVERRLTYQACIPLMREAMIALSQGRTKQLLRGIIQLGEGNMFGVMPGSLYRGREGQAAPQPAAASDGPGDLSTFGAKLVSIFPGNVAGGGLSHQGAVLLFDPESGAPTAVIDAGTLTAIRTASASAAATDALARPDATRLAILGTGEQARRHVEAIRLVRPISQVTIWGRDPARAEALAEAIGGVTAPTVAEAVAEADIICTTTGAAEPILFGRDVPDGAHLNLVGSSRAGPAEVDEALVARARFIADHREGVLAQGAEFLRAKAAGLVDDGHVVGEIGAVFAGALPGRQHPAQLTAYKSLGAIVQDLAAAAFLLGAQSDFELRTRPQRLGNRGQECLEPDHPRSARPPSFSSVMPRPSRPPGPRASRPAQSPPGHRAKLVLQLGKRPGELCLAFSNSIATGSARSPLP